MPLLFLQKLLTLTSLVRAKLLVISRTVNVLMCRRNGSISFKIELDSSRSIGTNVLELRKVIEILILLFLVNAISMICSIYESHRNLNSSKVIEIRILLKTLRSFLRSLVSDLPCAAFAAWASWTGSRERNGLRFLTR